MEAPELFTDEVTDVFRPIQYLGSKMRALGAIANFVKQLEPHPSTVLDIFAGTSVVSQALARAAFNVIATDAMSYSATFARALLGVGRKNDSVDIEELLDILRPSENPTPAQLGLGPWLIKEREAIAKRNADELFLVSKMVPQIWRPEGASELQLSQFKILQKSLNKSAFPSGNLMSAFYAGTYFGVIQATEIDRLRVSIEELDLSAFIDDWEKDVLLTALLSVASDCVFSAGKHFAQAHLIREGKDLSFLRQRILQDRSIDIWSVFRNRLYSIVNYACSANAKHHAYQATLETILDDKESLSVVDMIYADPPYTAQQYSRFYHIPETLIMYQIPQLQNHRGKVTRGLYPNKRHKSRFCSKRKAPAAFNDLLLLARSLDATLIISYSGTKSGKTGNARMISLDELLMICHQHSDAYKTSVVEFDHAYRQFNHTDFAVSGRHDKEFLIVCER